MRLEGLAGLFRPIDAKAPFPTHGLPLVALANVTVLATYFVAGRLGLELAFLHMSASAIWPPTGIAIAAVLLMGARVAPAVFLGAFLVNYTTSGSFVASIGIALGNGAEALVAAALLCRYGGGAHSFQSSGNVIRFVLFAAVVAPLVSAGIGISTLLATGLLQVAAVPAVAFTWWLGNAVGALAIAPPLILWATTPPTQWTFPKAAEFLLMFLVVIGACFLAFGLGHLPLSFLCLPPVLWAGFRFGPREASLATLIVASLALWSTLNESGPFALGSANTRLVVLQAFVGTLALVGMGMASVVEERRRAIDQLQASHGELENRVRGRTVELTQAVQNLESFAYSVSHDLRTPLRVINAYAQEVETGEAKLDEASRKHLARIRESTRHMAHLIDDLLELSRVSSRPLEPTPVDLSAMAQRIVEQLRSREPERSVTVDVQPGLTATADPHLIQVVMQNLLENAWKFTRGRADARIEVGASSHDGAASFFVRDNGAGFDMTYSHKLFQPFQRLHSEREFEGTGIGLASVRRIVTRHQGQIWAEAKPGEGAAFYFRLGS